MSKKYTVYTDGSCNPNPGPCSWGAILLVDEVPARESFAYIGVGTNNIAELTAAIRGLQMTPVGSTVEIASDSQYAMKGISEWREGWEKRGWKTSAKKDVENIPEWKALFKEVDARTVTTRWVKGHSKDKFNNIADKLADEGMDLRHLPESDRKRIVVRDLEGAHLIAGAATPQDVICQSAGARDCNEIKSEKMTTLLKLLGEGSSIDCEAALDGAIEFLQRKRLSDLSSGLISSTGPARKFGQR